MTILCGTSSIRDVIAFPKTQKGQCLMTQSPSVPTAKQLKNLHIASRVMLRAEAESPWRMEGALRWERLSGVGPVFDRFSWECELLSGTPGRD